MKIYITQPGDPSVGIWESTAVVELPHKNVEEIVGGGRNEFRKTIADFFADNIFGYKCHVLFEDECPDCNAMRREDMPGCPNEHCPTNMMENENG